MNWDWKIIEPILADQIKRKPPFVSGFYEIKRLLADNSLAEVVKNVEERRLQAEFNEWLKEILSNQLPQKVKSIYFGLFSMVNPENEDEEMTTIYFCGSASTPQDDDDWACWTEDSYLPDNKYLLLTDFMIIDQYFKLNSHIEGDLNVLVFHGLLNLLILNSLDKIRNSLTGTQKSLYLGTGFDGGDIVIMGKLTKTGLG